MAYSDACRQFYNLVKNNSSSEAKQFYDEKCKEIDVNQRNYADIFNYVCQNGDLELAKWFLELNKEDYPVTYSTAFCDACMNNNLEVAKWLFEKIPKMKFSFHYYDFMFQKICVPEKLEMAKFLLDVILDKMSYNYYSVALLHACENGCLEIAQILLEKNPDIDISYNSESAFLYAFYNGHLNVVKWLFSIKPTINISLDCENLFRVAILKNNLEMAKWVYSVKPDIDIFSIDYNIDNDEINEWLKTIKKIVLPIDHTKKIDLSTIGDKKCPICYDATISVQTNCGHNFCVSCIETVYNKKSLSKRCPCCRSGLNTFYSIE